MSSPVEILMNATSMDGPTRNNAEQQLKAASAHLDQFLSGLVGVISDESQPQAARQMAAIVLKNTVAVRSKDIAKKAALEAKWRELSPQTRGELKENILSGLGSREKNVRFVVALLVANLARIEIPNGQWDNLLQKLTDVCRDGADDFVEAALLTLGYICEETEESEDLDEAMQNASRPILDAIFSAMERNNNLVVYSATRCLVFSLNFIHNHMGVENERNYIVKCLCDRANSNDERTRERATEGIYRFADLYYHLLPQYMDQLCDVTVNAIKNFNNNENAAMFAIMFWSTICETESEMDPKDNDYKGIVQRYKKAIFDTMWNALQCQEDGQTNEDWNISIGASRVLAEMARALGNDVLPLAMNTAMSNVTSNQWRVQDAAIVLFGCILPAPEPELIRNEVNTAMPPLSEIACNSRSHECVRDSSAWVLGQIAAFFPNLMLTPQVFPNIYNTVKTLLQADPLLAERGLSILHNLAVDVDDRYNSFEDDDNNRPHSNEFSSAFSDLVADLGRILDAPNAPDNVRAIAQETLNVVIHAAADDVRNVLDSLIPILTGKLTEFVQQRQQNGSTPYLNTQVALLTGAITAVARKLGRDLNNHAQKVLPAVHSTLQVPPAREQSILNSNTTGYSPDDEEEATTMAGVESVLCISALINALGDNMWPHLNQFTPFLISGIRQTEDEDVYTACLGVFGDIANTFGPRANQLVMLDALAILRDQLWSEETPITVKPDIMKCIGDIALYYGVAFTDFAPHFLKIVQDLDGMAREQDLSDEENRENVLDLLEGIATFCSQVLQGMKNDLSPILNFLPWMVSFAEGCGMKFTTSDPDLLESLCALLGDIASVMKGAPPEVLSGARSALDTDGIKRVLRGAREFTQVEAVSETADWAIKQIGKLMGGGGGGNNNNNGGGRRNNN